ncbi:hypothetical protein H0H87_011090 [Tephrocybe sp. NHM501043]|nr:hypothetical protein H0H87_011090 [Tephrocybe sp. NHM501043]
MHQQSLRYRTGNPFLIEGAEGAILHTGDFRAEPWFIETITRNPFLQPYLAPRTNSRGISKTLKAIYLDTASITSKLSVPTKDSATSGLIEMMHLFPDSVYFYLNTWTWGYEDILKAVSREFASLIHVDRYKCSVYQHISDPFLRSIVTQDPSCTRFHACERFNRCEFVAVDDDPEQQKYNTISHLGKKVVYVNPVNMGIQSWALYINDTKARLSRGEEVNNLLVPLSRHSPLDELRTFVTLFRPHRVIPNTLEPRLRGFDWAAIESMFVDCLHPEPNAAGIPNYELDLVGPATKDVEKEDVYMQNLVGEGAADIADRWADKSFLRKKLEIFGEYLDLEIPRPSKKRANDEKGHSLASPIVLSSSPVGLPILFAKPPKPYSIHKAREGISTPLFRKSKTSVTHVTPHCVTPTPSTSYLPPSSPPINAPSSSPLGEVNNISPDIFKSLGKRASLDTCPQPNTPSHKRHKTPSSSQSLAKVRIKTTTIPQQEEGLSSVRRSQLRRKRLSIAERLVEARPDLVDPSYAGKRTRLLARSAGSAPLQPFQSAGWGAPRNTKGKDNQEKGNEKLAIPILESFETVEDDDGGMDWNRSKRLEEALRADVLNGRRPMLPALLCAESQSQGLEDN